MRALQKFHQLECRIIMVLISGKSGIFRNAAFLIMEEFK